MGDVVPPPEEEPKDEEFAEKLVDLRNRLDDATHLALTGARSASIRRPILFGIVAWGLLFSGLWAGFGIVALLALALTDHVVDL